METALKFYPLTESDLTLLTNWLNRPHLQKWWRSEKVSLEKVKEKYLPRIRKKDTARPYIVKMMGKAIGYIQYYSVDDGDPEWWPDQPNPGTVGIDLFIADQHNLSKGLGTAMIVQFIKFLQEGMYLSEIRVDPHPDNCRAIRCYQKAGFRIVQEIVTPNGPAVMMILKSEAML